MHWIDSHVHLSSYNDQDLGTLFLNSKQQNICEWVMAGYDSADWNKQLLMASSFTKKSFGLHPWRVLELSQSEIDLQMENLGYLFSRADACGETGIDGFRAKSDEDILLQEQVFIQHLEMNKGFQKPLVLHIVKSHERAQGILKKYPYVGIVHGFSGSWEVAQVYIKMGFKISVGRGVYSRGYKTLKDVVRRVNLSDVVIESDAFVDPVSGPEDAPAILGQVIAAVCEIKKITPIELMEWNFKNIKGIFGS